MNKNPEKESSQDLQLSQTELDDLVLASFRKIIDVEWAKVANLAGVKVSTPSFDEITQPQRNILHVQARWSEDYPTQDDLNR